MFRRIGIGLLWGLGAYVVGALCGAMLISFFSTNQHDKDVEAAMTGAFIFGPLAAFIGFVLGVWRSKTKHTVDIKSADGGEP